MMLVFKPMLADDWREGKVKFPAYIQPKIDGVRALNLNGTLLARSLKKHENQFVTDLFSKREYSGFDGEMILGTDPTAPDLCRFTSGAMRRQGEAQFTWYLFDYVADETNHLPYADRRMALINYVHTLPDHLKQNLRIMPTTLVQTQEEVDAYDTVFLDEGYEGSILRDPASLYKCGRSDGKMQVWRIKRFIDAEFLIEKIVEGNHNANEAKTNELGRTERSSHQENMQPNGLVGSLEGTLLADVLDPQSKAVIIPKGTWITVSPGNLTAAERKYYFENQHEMLKQIGKFKLFPKGTKEKPRFPTLISIRSKEDM